jgi:uncharacterized protein (TIGR02466 family)
MPVEYFFPTPVYHNIIVGGNFDIVQGEIAKSIEDIDVDALKNPWDDTVKTTFTYDSARDFLEKTPHFKDIILENAQEYVNTCIPRNGFTGMSITESWINFTTNGGFQNYHVHPLADISGVYYYATNKEDGNIKFKSSSSALNHSPLTMRSRAEHKPLVGKLLLFPSFLEHAVGLNTTDHTRISVSFNIKLQW